MVDRYQVNTITPKTLAALRLIGEAGERGMTPGEFAPRFWPDSPKLNVSYRAGPYASVRGRGLVKAAGGYLGILRKRGLIERRRVLTEVRGKARMRDGGYVLTSKGSQALL